MFGKAPPYRNAASILVPLDSRQSLESRGKEWWTDSRKGRPFPHIERQSREPMESSVEDIINSYDPSAPLERAATIPAAWYIDQRIFELEKQTVFSRSWQLAARIDQL